MSGLRRGVKGRRAAWGIILSVLVVSITLVCSGIALADKWTDISDAQWQSQYGVTAAQAATVAGGFQDGTFHPKEAVKRGQFAKMVVDGFGVSTYSPTTSTFPDVAKSNTFFKYIEGGVKAGIISGYSDGTFKPNNTVTRQQANNILGAYLSDKELDENGLITGSKGTYGSLSAWYGAEGALILAAFKDAAKVAAVHAPGTAYLVFHEVVKGSNGALTPGSTLTRAQAVALIIRVREADFGGGALPTVTSVNPAAGLASGGNGVIITGTNFTAVASVKFGTTSSAFTVNSATQITATAPAGSAGTTVDITVTTVAGTSVAGAGSKYSFGGPVITQIAPAGGSANGNTTVSITGTGFTGVTAVKFGNIAAKSYTVVSPTSITAVSPAGANGTVVDVTVTTPAGTSAVGTATKYTYGVPAIAKLEPAAGPATGATSVVITGSGFVDVTGVTGVKFGTVNATSYIVNTSEKITAIAPAGTAGTTVDVIITNNIGQSGTAGMESKYSYGVPTITKLNPTGGPEAGGTSITITGTGFTGVSAVKFGTVAAKSFIVSSPTTMTAVAPAGTAGSTVEVYITTPAGTNVATGTANDYSYGVPTITAVTPAAGPTAGANSVVITGNNFVGLTLAEQVKFGAKNALAYTVNSSTQITATVPSGTAGTTVQVTVTNAAGASPTSAGAMYSYGIPVVTSIDPVGGPLSGANSVVINGTGFTGVTAVKFGVATVSFTVNSPTKITATAPAGALDTIVDVTVTTPAGVSVVTESSKYRYILSPSIDSVSPPSGIAGTVVTITGDYFVSVSSVKFNLVSLTLNQTGTLGTGQYRVDSDSQITAKAPSGIADGVVADIRVTNAVGLSPNTSADNFTYGAAQITGLNPVAGPESGGNTVNIIGSGFIGVDWVRFYYTGSHTVDVPFSNFSVNSAGTQITAIVPAYEGVTTADYTVDILVHNSTGTSTRSANSKYTYGPPVITSLEPNGGSSSGNNTVVINGYGFTGTAGSMSVMFGTTPATITSINTSPVDDPATAGWDESRVECTKITVTAPPQGSMGSTVNVVVTTPAGASTTIDPADNDYHYGVPIVSGVSPAAGPVAGGNSVVITGSNFTPTSQVWFGTDQVPAPDINYDSSTQLTVYAPNGPDNRSRHVTVVNSAGTSIETNADWYSFGKPVIASITPSGGPATGATSVLIKGSGFTGLSGATAVKFGSVNAASYDVDESTLGDATQEMTVVSPAGTDSVYITISNTAGTSATGPFCQFFYGIPTITSLSPAAGPTGGANTVVITGTNFGSVSESTPSNVRFGAANATSFDVVSSTRIDAVAPAGSGTVTVTVTNGTNSSLPTYASRYAYGKPVITGLSPTGGPAGTEVTIAGTGFTGLSGASAVRFGVTNATSYTITDDTEIKAIAPAGSGTIDVRVVNPAGTSDASAVTNYTYGTPAVIGLSPGAGTVGDLVIITGTNFTGDCTVKFGNTTVDPDNLIINSTMMITAIVPGMSGDILGTVDVTVTNGAGTSATSAASKWSYGVPTIVSITPNNGVAGGQNFVTIVGTRFTGVEGVRFNGIDAVTYTVNSPTSITAKVPAGDNGTTVPVVIENGRGISAPAYYHYGLPTITSLEEASGPNGGGTGDPVIIHGTNFVNIEHVYFGGAEVSSLNYEVNLAHTAITVNNVPNQSDITVDVTVVTQAGTTVIDLNCEYTYGPPAITLLNPATGPAAGNNTVVITGWGFTGVRTVKFGGVAVSSINVTVNSPTQITVKAPPGSVGTVNVEVTTWGGSSPNTAADNYTYY